MKILHLQTGSALTGGVANYISSLTSGKGIEGVEFSVVCLMGEKDLLNKNRLYGSANIVEIYGKDQFTYYFRGLFKIIKFLKTSKTDILHIHCLKSGLLALPILLLYPQTKVIYTNHGVRYSLETIYFTKVFYFLCELLVGVFSDRYVSIRETDHKLAKSLKLNDRKYTLLKTFRPETHVQTRSLRLIPYKTEKEIILCFVGSLIEMKNPERYLNWVKLLVNQDRLTVNAQIFGDGPLRKELEAIVRREGLPVTFEGNVCQKRIFEVYQKHAFVYLCNTSKIDTLPLSVIEAYVWGVPVLTNSRPGLSDYFENLLTGYLIDDDSITQDAIQQLTSLQKYSRLSENCQNYCEEKFPSHNTWVDTYCALYADVLKD